MCPAKLFGAKLELKFKRSELKTEKLGLERLHLKCGSLL